MRLVFGLGKKQDLTLCILTPFGFADIFNVQHYSAISKTVGRLNTLMVEDKKVKLQYEKLRNGLMSEVKI